VRPVVKPNMLSRCVPDIAHEAEPSPS
jgi:hypothetical protein